VELNGSAFTVVVANDDDDGLRARELALAWHEEGLLGEFAWVTPEDVQVPAYGPPTISATVMGRDEPVELMTLLGARPRSLIRIVVLHLLTHENSSAARLVEACNHISELVSRAMPRQLRNGGSAAGMRLLRVNLMVPESDLLPQDAGLIEPGWEINAIVSPEDRPDLDRMSVFVRQSVNLHGHGLAAAAAVGGLWSDSPIGAFDNHQTDSTTGGREVVVIRCQARMVVGDDRSSELADKVVTIVQSSEMGAAPLVTWGIPADNPEAVVNNTVDKLLTHPQWAREEREVRPLEKAQLSLGTVLKNWALFQLQMPIAVFTFLFGLGRSAMEKAITAATVGRDAGEVGRVRPMSPDQAQQVAEFRMKKLSDQLEPARLHDEAASWGQTTPAAWRELREVAIGLVDGSRLPDRYSRTTRGGLDEVLPPFAVVPTPDDSLTLPGMPRLSGIDVGQVAEVAQQLEAREQEEAEKHPAETSGDDETEDVEPSDKDRLAAWVEKRKHSLMWLVASRIYDFRRLENAQAQASYEALTNTKVPSTGRLRTAQALVVIAWLLTVFVAVLVGLWVWASSREDMVAFLTRLPELNWQNITRVVLVVALALLLAGTNYFQALRAYEWQVALRLHTVRQASDEYVTSRQQEKRWALMFQGVQDWGRVFGELLHRPWAEAESEEKPVGEYDGLPAAVAIATPVDADAGSDPRVVTKGVEAVCQRGWLAKEFGRIVASSPRNDPAAQPHAGDLPADLDLGLRANGPRTELVQVAEDEPTKDVAKRHLVDEVAVLVAEGDVTMPAQTVVRLGPYSARDQVVDRDFFTASNNIESPLTTELFDPQALVARYNIPEHTVFCLPVGSDQPKLENAEVHYCGVSVATRVDISPNLTADGILLFQRAERLDVSPVASADEFN
jgi:hypothetical protein